MDNSTTMRILEYQTNARDTAIYPNHARFYYPALGLCGEVGEVVDLLIPGVKTTVAKTKILGELGDVLWYLTNVALDLKFGIPCLADIITGGLRCDTFEDISFQRKTPRDKRSPFIRLIVNSGHIAEIAKKQIRGDAEGLSAEKMETVRLALANCLVALCELCEKHGVTLDDVAEFNNKKLKSRLERGKLQGDGDDR